MIIYRYLAKEIAFSTIAVATVLAAVLLVGRFVKYLGYVTEGNLLVDVLLPILGYRFPGFLELVLPLSLFLGIMLAYGKLYMDNEMSVLSACGVTQNAITLAAFIPAAMIIFVVGFCSFVLTPWSNVQVDRILTEQKERSDLDMLSPGFFHLSVSRNEQRATYAHALSEDRSQLKGVFMAVATEADRPVSIVTAQVGDRMDDEASGSRYLILHDGYRYVGRPGEANFEVIRFEQYKLRLPDIVRFSGPTKSKMLTSAELWERADAPSMGELQWRISMPISVLIAVLLAVPLSRVNPRAGRFFKVLPALIIFLSYVGLIVSARGWMDDGEMDVRIGVWPIHGAYLLIGVALWLWYEKAGRLTRART